jgi:hypothetical protein
LLQQTLWAPRLLCVNVVLWTGQAAFSIGGYKSGRFELIEVPDARCALSDAQTERNNALHEVQQRRAKLDRLLGRDSK